ncbi:murein biosynthesis integral membrane protein MurJ [Fusobacterium periodonticum]|nr:murein biosynthesis integral membrane protein MurJ [Fusobacterium periodonticum]
MGKIIIIAIIFNIISKFLAFFRELSLAYFFGASLLTDAYLVAISIPTTIFGIIGSGILNGYIPMYNHIRENSNTYNAKRFTNNFINVMLLFSFIVFLFGFSFSDFLVKLFSFGFDKATLELASFYTKISIFSIFPIILVSIFSGFLQVNNKFLTVAFISIPTNFIYIIGSYIAYKTNIFTMLVLFTCLAMFFQLIFLYPFVLKNKFKFSFKVNLYDKNLHKLLMLGIPIIIGTSLEQINSLIDRTVASGLGSGSITILNYATKLNGAMLSLSVIAILSILYPKFSRLVSENNIKELKEQIKYIINMIFIFSIPTMFGIIALNREVSIFIFGRGNLDRNSVLATAKCLSAYSLCFVALCLRDLATKIFYSFKDSKTPVINSGIGIGLNIILNIILSKYLGIIGIALATSVSTVFISILLFYNLRRYDIYLEKSNLIILSKVLVASSFMILVIYLSKKYLSSYGNFSILIYMINAGISYILAVLLLGVNEVKDLFKLFLKVFKLKR